MQVVIPVIGQYTDEAPNPNLFTNRQRQWAALARCTHFLVFGPQSDLALKGSQGKTRAHNREAADIWNAFVWLLGYDKVVDLVNRIRNNPSTQRTVLWPVEQTEFLTSSGKPGPKYSKQWVKNAKRKKILKDATERYQEEKPGIPSWDDVESGEGFEDEFWTFLYEEVDTGDLKVQRYGQLLNVTKQYTGIPVRMASRMPECVRALPTLEDLQLEIHLVMLNLGMLWLYDVCLESKGSVAGMLKGSVDESFMDVDDARHEPEPTPPPPRFLLDLKLIDGTNEEKIDGDCILWKFMKLKSVDSEGHQWVFQNELDPYDALFEKNEEFVRAVKQIWIGGQGVIFLDATDLNTVWELRNSKLYLFMFLILTHIKESDSENFGNITSMKTKLLLSPYLSDLFVIWLGRKEFATNLVREDGHVNGLETFYKRGPTDEWGTEHKDVVQVVRDFMFSRGMFCSRMVFDVRSVPTSMSADQIFGMVRDFQLIKHFDAVRPPIESMTVTCIYNQQDMEMQKTRADIIDTHSSEDFGHTPDSATLEKQSSLSWPSAFILQVCQSVTAGDGLSVGFQEYGLVKNAVEVQIPGLQCLERGLQEEIPPQGIFEDDASDIAGASDGDIEMGGPVDASGTNDDEEKDDVVETAGGPRSVNAK